MRTQGTYLGSVVLIVAVLLLAGIPRATGQAGPGAVQVSRLELVDEEGVVRASLAMGEYGPALTLCDEQGKTSVKLSDYDTAPEDPRVLRSGERGPGLRIYDGVNEKARGVLFLCDAGPRLVLANSAGAYTASLEADERSAGCYVSYPNGIHAAILQAGAPFGAGLRAINPQGAERFWGWQP